MTLPREIPDGAETIAAEGVLVVLVEHWTAFAPDLPGCEVSAETKEKCVLAVTAVVAEEKRKYLEETGR